MPSILRQLVVPPLAATVAALALAVPARAALSQAPSSQERTVDDSRPAVSAEARGRPARREPRAVRRHARARPAPGHALTSSPPTSSCRAPRAPSRRSATGSSCRTRRPERASASSSSSSSSPATSAASRRTASTCCKRHAGRRLAHRRFRAPDRRGRAVPPLAGSHALLRRHGTAPPGGGLRPARSRGAPRSWLAPGRTSRRSSSSATGP